MELVLERAVYGEKGIPMLKRDYNIINLPTSAVGTISEILEYCKENELSIRKILLIDGIEKTNTTLTVDEDYNFTVANWHYMV